MNEISKEKKKGVRRDLRDMQTGAGQKARPAAGASVGVPV